MKKIRLLLASLIAFMVVACSREESDWQRWSRVISAKEMSPDSYSLQITKVSKSLWVASFTEKGRPSTVFTALIEPESNRVIEWVTKLANGHDFQVPANGRIEMSFSVLQVDGKDVVR